MITHGLLVCAALLAGLAQGPQVAVEAVPRECSAARFFSGQRIRVAFRFYGGQGQELDLRARPFQLAHSLAAPIGPPLEVVSDFAPGDEAWHDFSLTLDCPAVDRITTWELRHQSRVAGEDSWRAVGATRIELYPPDLLQPLRELTKTQPWFVSDPPGELRAFLTAHEIPFRDLESPDGRQAFERHGDERYGTERNGARRRGSGKQPALVLWVREPADPLHPRVNRRRMPAPEKAARVLVFEEPSPLLPTTTLRLEPRRTRVTVDIHLLHSLTDDPLAQSRLVEAIRMTQLDLGEGFDE